MTAYLALLRGINVGGHHRLKMADLKTWVNDLAITQVKTYLQSGNLLFCSDAQPLDLQQQITDLLNARLDFQVPVLVLSHAEVRQALANSPYLSQAQAEPKSVHFCFLATAPQAPDLSVLSSRCCAGESFALHQQVLHLHYPNGSGTSKLTLPLIEKSLQSWGTARNWNSLSKIENLMTSEKAGLA